MRIVKLTRLLLVSLLGATSAVFAAEPVLHNQWTHWRGPEANGVAREAAPPLTWSETENVRWKIPIAGHGTTTPIVFGDKIFLLTAVDTGRADPSLPKPEEQPKRPFGIIYPNTTYEYIVLCLDRNTGRELWKKIAIEKIPHEGHHGDNSFASASPTTDGERLYAWFGGAGLYCYDLDGELLWKRDLGTVNTRLSFGEGCSPVVYRDRLIVNRDNEDQSTITVLDSKSGKTVWSADRDEPSAWATPLVVEVGGTTQVITNASNRVRSYDLADGSLIWECGGQVGNVIPSPVTNGELVFCLSGYRGSAALAIPLDSTGDLTGSDKIAWSVSRGSPYVPSPLLYDGLLYFNKSNDAIISCIEAQTGKILIGETRLPGVRRIYASPVGAAGRVYFVGRDGDTTVLERGEELKVLATNQLDEGCETSPAIVGKQMFLRGKNHLYCLEEGQ
ncbi:MAG TPA: PQQ-binding-like beta-propeller repeat protein [Planctomycetaceae bacterium]|nr:PQQ-binding-like beta-propeller repeat protein [Planctomycetaceae bacterium]